jgi:hypothetical protein
MSTEPELIKDDDATVISDDVEEQQAQPVVVAAKPVNKFYLWFAVGLVVTAGIFGLVFGITSQHSDDATAGSPALVTEDASGDAGATASTTDFQLTESMPHISAINLDNDEIVYIDGDTGCLNVISYTAGNNFEPLCGHFSKIRSVYIHDDSVIIAQSDTIEHYERSDSEWLRNPGGAKRTSIIKNSSPGFGKKTVFLQTYTQLVIASDENVYVYKRQNMNMWKLKKTFEMANFAVNDDQSTLAIYDSDSVTVFDLSLNRWYIVDDPITYNPSSPISSVQLSEDGVHIVSTPVDNMFTVSNVATGEFTRLIFESKIVGDAVYSVNSGCVVDAITGEYLSVDVQDADDVFDIKISDDRIVVLLEREGETMMDIYEK